MDYFALFSLPRHLHLDTEALEKSFYAQSRRLHPDRFAARPAEEQAEALRRSSALNDAYRTLKDPIARTEYLLSLEGVQMEEQSRQATDAARAAGTEKKQVAPPDLLEEAFELNMQLEEMRFAKQAGEKDQEAEYNLQVAQGPLFGDAQRPPIPTRIPLDALGYRRERRLTRPPRPPRATPWSPFSTAAPTSATWCAT